MRMWTLTMSLRQGWESVVHLVLVKSEVGQKKQAFVDNRHPLPQESRHLPNHVYETETSRLRLLALCSP